MYSKDKSELLALKRYLQSVLPATPLPPDDVLLSPNSIAIRAAISGLDSELAKLEKEEQRHIVGKPWIRSTEEGAKIDDDEEDLKEYVQMSQDDISPEGFCSQNMNIDQAHCDDSEWQEATIALASEQQQQKNQAHFQLHPSNNSLNCHYNEVLAQKWATSTISRISRANVKVQTPLGALGLVLHAAILELLSSSSVSSTIKKEEVLFRCTGIPPEDVISELVMAIPTTEHDLLPQKQQQQQKENLLGFAPPARELPKGTLVPPKWEHKAVKSFAPGGTVRILGHGSDDDTWVVAFRYKCGKQVYSTNDFNTSMNLGAPTTDASTVYLLLRQKCPRHHDYNENNDPIEDEVVVTFGPLPLKKSSLSNSDTTEENSMKIIRFPLALHINIDGFRAAREKCQNSAATTVSPLLFYKSLPELLLQFGSDFGLVPSIKVTFGDVNDNHQTGEDVVMTHKDANVSSSSSSSTSLAESKGACGPAIDQSAAVRAAMPYPSEHIVNTSFPVTDPLHVMHSQRDLRRRGDFEGDLLPGGPLPGLVAPTTGTRDGDGLGGGNLVGPNHSLFDRTFGDDDDGVNYGFEDDLGLSGGRVGGNFVIPGTDGGLRMRPRFDPYGPPGGPTEPGRMGRGRFGRQSRGVGRGGRGPTPPGGFGYPNPDHLRPPGGDYFS